jgi:hypothetical protein
MSKPYLCEGAIIHRLIWNDDAIVTAGEGSCHTLTVRETCGHMGMVPTHIEQVNTDGKRWMHNISTIESLQIPGVLK